MIKVLIKGGNLETDMCTERKPCEGEGREWDDVSANQGMTKMTNKTLEAR